MDNKNIFKQYYSRLAIEGLIKALILSAIVGFVSSIALAIITYFVIYNIFWIIFLSLGAGIVITAGCTALLYFAFFTPDTKQIAERVDRLGLDERMLTMLELNKDESYIAMRQREDAKENLKRVNHKQLKFSLFKIPLIVLAVLAVCSVTVITVSAVIVEPKIGWEEPGPSDIDANKNVYVRVTYIAGEGGYVDENSDQFVLWGEDAKPVVAIPQPHYAFDRWSDGEVKAERTDKKITAEKSVVAMFVKIDEGLPNTPPPSGMTGGYQERNLILDNETYYRDRYDDFYAQMIAILDSSDDMPEYMREFIELYFKAIT